MDLDDLPKKKDDFIADLEKEDIDTLGPEELAERIERLEALKQRYQAAIDARGSSRAAAEALFN